MSITEWRMPLRNCTGFFQYKLNLCLMLCFVLCCNCSLADMAAMERLRSQAPSAWQRIRGEYNKGKEYTRSSVKLNTFSSSKLPTPIAYEEKVISTDIRRLSEHLYIRSNINIKKIDESLGSKAPPLETVEPKITEVSTLLNAQYKGRFSEGPPAQLYTFKKLEHIDSEVMNLDFLTMPALRLGFSSMLDRSLVGFPNFRLVEGHGSYIVSDAEEFVGENGDALVKVQVDLGVFDDHGKLISKSEYFNDGVLILDPARDWCMVSYRGKHLNKSGAVELIVECAAQWDPSNKSFHPSTLVTKNIKSHGDTSVETEIFESLSESNLKISDCYFSAHGLPEPAADRPSRILTVVLSIIVIILLVLVVRRRLLIQQVT